MLQQFAPLVGRTLLALIFIFAGFHKITGFEGTAGYMASHGLPMPQVLLVATIVIELIGGLMLLIGWQAKLAAAAIFLFLIPSSETHLLVCVTFCVLRRCRLFAPRCHFASFGGAIQALMRFRSVRKRIRCVVVIGCRCHLRRVI